MRQFTEEQVIEMVDDAFHRFAIDSRWEAQEYIKEKFFTSTNKQSTPCCPKCNGDNIFNVCQSCGHRFCTK